MLFYSSIVNYIGKICRYLTFLGLIFLLSCTHISSQEDIKYWTRFKTQVGNKANTIVSFSLPPGAEIIKAPNSFLELNQQSEYVILTAGYPYYTEALHDIHISFVFYKSSQKQNHDVIALSNSLSSKIHIITHNSNLSWHKNAGKTIVINNSIWLHREGYSTGPNTDQKLDIKNEDAYLHIINDELALGVYITYYEGTSINQSFANIVPKIVSNINVY